MGIKDFIENFWYVLKLFLIYSLSLFPISSINIENPVALNLSLFYNWEYKKKQPISSRGIEMEKLKILTAKDAAKRTDHRLKAYLTQWGKYARDGEHFNSCPIRHGIDHFGCMCKRVGMRD